MLLPILIPSFMGLAMLRLSLESRDSRSRLKLLEKDESYRERLVHIVGQLERTLEDAAVEYMDDPGTSAGSSQTLLRTESPPEGSRSKGPSSTSTPILTPPSGLLSHCQLKIVESLNKIPNLKKERVFIDPVVNSHAVIIARNVQRFEYHKTGHGVLQHLADNFVM